MNIMVFYWRHWRGGRAGGAEIHTLDLIRELSAKGHQLVLVTAGAESNCKSTAGVVAQYELPFSVLHPLDNLRAYRGLAEIVDRHQIDIIHAHHRTAGYYGELMYRNRQVPYVITVHDAWHSTALKSFHSRIFRRLIAVSESVKRTLMEKFHIAPERIRTIYNGVDARTFTAVDPAQVALFREKFGIRGQVVISLVGRISRVKGHYDLLHALRLLPRELNYKCLIVGEGNKQKDLEALTRRYDLAEKVVFCGYRSDIPVVMAASDIVLLPSHRESFGLPIVEAMLSRRAVIASTAGGIPEIITHEKDGILFEAGDVAALAGGIARLVSDESLRLCLANAGHKTAVERFLLDRMIRETENYYGEITRAAKAPNC